MGAVGLKTHIWSNNFKSMLLLAGFPVLLLGMTYALILFLMGFGALPSTGDVDRDFTKAGEMMAAGAPLAILVALVWFAIAYAGYQWIIDVSTGAKKVERTEEPELYNLLENLAISRGMKTPALRIVESAQLNAFATGLHEGRYSVTVTRGLMQALTRDELEAVLAHELTHVINRDVRLMVIAAIFAGIITLLAQIMFRALYFTRGGGGRRGGKGGGGGIIILAALAFAAVGYVLAIVIKMTISRKREFIADAGSVELTKNPDAMISALTKISGHSHLEAPDSVQSMFLDHHEEGVMGLFASHPPIDKRIDALVQFAGGKRPEPAPAVTEADGAVVETAEAPRRLTDYDIPAAGRPGPWSR